jgi:hypothetical protein
MDLPRSRRPHPGGALPDLGKGQEFGDAATHGRAERAVLDLLTAG